MPTFRTRQGIELFWQEEGEGDPLLMIMGIGAQLIHWPQGLVDLLVERGFRVIRFDNRDVGNSTRLREAGVVAIGPLMVRGVLGMPTQAPYRLADMATDTAELIEHLEIGPADVVGISMGGMILQHLAMDHPQRLARMTILMSSAGSRRNPPSLKALRALASKGSATREQAIEGSVQLMRAIGSPAYPFDEAYQRELAAEAYDRAHSPDGFARQLAAIAATPAWAERLREVKAPTLVMHGEADPLLRVAGGREIAESIPGAELVTLSGWGHDMPAALWPTLADAIAAHHRGGRLSVDAA